MRKLNCAYVEEKIHDFLHDHLNRRDTDLILTHIGYCDRCFNSFNFHHKIYEVYHPEIAVSLRRITERVMNNITHQIRDSE